MSESIQIRPARPEDGSRIGELLVSAFVDTYAKKMPEVVVTERRKAELRDVVDKSEAASVLVAEIEEMIVGTVAIFPPDYADSHSWLPWSAEVRYMAVEPAYQGKSIASSLLEECVRAAREWGCESIFLHVRRGASGIARLYEKHGYRRAPEGDMDKLPEVFLEAYVLPL